MEHLLSGSFLLSAYHHTVMARNTGQNFRIGAVKDRSQVYNPSNDTWTKRAPNGQFMDQKADNKPFKGVTKES